MPSRVPRPPTASSRRDPHRPPPALRKDQLSTLFFLLSGKGLVSNKLGYWHVHPFLLTRITIVGSLLPLEYGLRPSNDIAFGHAEEL